MICTIDVGFGNLTGKSTLKSFDLKMPAIISNFVPITFPVGQQNDFETEGICNPSQCSIGYKGKDYFVGKSALRQAGGRNTIDPERTVSLEGEILLMTALSVLAESDKNINLVVGLPEGHYDNLRDKYVALANGVHEIEILSLSGAVEEIKNIRIDETIVIPQQLGTFFDFLLDDKGSYIEERKKYAQGNIGIIDIGYNTLDIGRIDHLVPIKKQCRTFPLGMFSAFQDLSTEIYSVYGVSIPPEKLEPFVIRGEISIFGQRKPIHDLINKVFTIHAERIVSVIKSSWPDRALLDLVLVSGGGAIPLGECLCSEFQGIAQTVNRPLFANVDGYMKYAMRCTWGRD